MKRSLVILFYALTVAQAVTAQQVPTDDPVAAAPLRLGVVGVSPRFQIANVGVDTNVFNSATDRQRDFTFTAMPGADLFLRTGRGLLSISAGAEFVYFQEFDTERSLNSHATGQYEFRFNRVRPYVSAGTLNTKQRPGYEIDVRARHYEADFKAGTDFRFMSKSTARIELRKLDYSFAGDAVFGGRPLNQELNRTLKAADLSWRQRLTALTTWVTRVSRETERFEVDQTRNSDSFRLSSGFELGRFALIRGSAFAGFRKLTAADGGTLPGFSGITADVDVSYTAPTQTRLGAIVNRDVQYSYDIRTPYYVQTGWTATLTQRVIGRWDVQLSGGRDRLSYQASNPADERLDHIGRFGGGVGYAVGDQIRVSFDVNSFYRSSDLPGREYGGVRSGLSVSYGY
jgi:hypothetical protein